MASRANAVRVGTGVLIFKEKKILLGKRVGAHGAHTWAPPGGHLEFGEEPEECAKREVLEEVGIEIKNIRRGPYTNDIFISEKKHYITLFILADYASGEVEVKERDKCEQWDWFAPEHLPGPLFLPLQNLLSHAPSILSPYFIECI
ncbi:MAG: NUDIX domain-containing protein [Oligoflexia bacterium]|nr:NUDIX domain-containing protein [Oligoflexia bacterium]MBF0366032.1 NUDIX domain-containing protein [Oligoflexia bacterium]